jgi:hypothetical protein
MLTSGRLEEMLHALENAGGLLGRCADVPVDTRSREHITTWGSYKPQDHHAQGEAS